MSPFSRCTRKHVRRERTSGGRGMTRLLSTTRTAHAPLRRSMTKRRVCAVARKTIANRGRKLARQAPPRAAIGGEPEPVGDGALAAAFAALSERDREVLRLVAWEGLSLHDASVVLGCSAVACRVRYHRAKSRLASRLEAAVSFRPE